MLNNKCKHKQTWDGEVVLNNRHRVKQTLMEIPNSHKIRLKCHLVNHNRKLKPSQTCLEIMLYNLNNRCKTNLLIHMEVELNPKHKHRHRQIKEEWVNNSSNKCRWNSQAFSVRKTKHISNKCRCKTKWETTLINSKLRHKPRI